MSLPPRTSDALVGLLVVGVTVVATAALIVTRGWTERRTTMYMLSPSVQDLKPDTPVLLQGLAIGEVKAISPQVDSGRMGPPQFLVELRLREQYANGVPIKLPLGTRAEIVSSGLIGNASISLIVPLNDIQAALVPGDTIRGTLTQGWTDVLKEVADTVRTQVSDILRESRRLLATMDRTAGGVDAQVRAIGPQLNQTLAQARATLEELQPTIASANGMLQHSDARLATLQDSVLLVLSDTRRMIASADTLTRQLTGITGSVGPEIQKTLANLRLMSVRLDYFIEQVSRRPHRLLTGVRQMEAEREQADSTKASPVP